MRSQDFPEDGFRKQMICGLQCLHRGVAQPGSASGLGPEGRRFESYRPDHKSKKGLVHRGLFSFLSVAQLARATTF